MKNIIFAIGLLLLFSGCIDISCETGNYPEGVNNRGQCYVDLGVKSGNPEYCNMAYSGEQVPAHSIAICKALVAKDYTYCDNLGEIEPEFAQSAIEILGSGLGKDSCYAEIAILKRDASLCEKLSTAKGRKNCNDFLLIASGDEEKIGAWQEVEGCKQVNANACGGEVDKYQEECESNPEYTCFPDKLRDCYNYDEYSWEDYGRDGFPSCVTYAAEDNQDVSLCEELQNKNPNNCTTEFCLQEDNCALDINEEECAKYFCYYRVALSSDDFSICEKIEDQKLREECNSWD